jgi:predicted ribosome quality control (RQC) complex YloA/Tae2 family protein
MINLTKEQRQLRHKIEEFNDHIKEIQSQIEEYQKNCNHVFSYYPNPNVYVKYCIICGLETYK